MNKGLKNIDAVDGDCDRVDFIVYNKKECKNSI